MVWLYKAHYQDFKSNFPRFIHIYISFSHVTVAYSDWLLLLGTCIIYACVVAVTHSFTVYSYDMILIISINKYI